MKKYVERFRIETRAGRLVGYACAIEAAEFIASRGRGRYIFQWIDGRYRNARQYN